MTKAKVRKDLLEQGLTPPTSVGFLDPLFINSTMTCYQPDELDDVEFNLILVLPNKQVVAAQSIDFEFVDDVGSTGCPKCSSESVTYEPVEIDGASASQECFCNDCNNHWFEVYKFSHISQ
jgi:hypothetical protein